MAFTNSLHKQYGGTQKTRGLQHAFLLLQKKGLTTVQTKGMFHHNLEDAIYHVAEAHIREDWEELAGVDDLSELRKRTPEELYALATRIVDECVLRCLLSVCTGTTILKTHPMSRARLYKNELRNSNTKFCWVTLYASGCRVGGNVL